MAQNCKFYPTGAFLIAADQTFDGNLIAPASALGHLNTTVADLGGGGAPIVCRATDQNFFNFMRYFRKKYTIH